MDRSEALNELATALATFQGTIGSVGKDKTANIPTKSGGSYSYSYADLSSIWDAIRKPLSESGLSVVQMPEIGDGMVYVSTLVLHTSGQWIQSTVGTRPADTTPQAIGSAITYLRRYGLGAMLGIVTDVDDDGAAGSQSKRPPQIERAPRPSAPVPQARRTSQEAPRRADDADRVSLLAEVAGLATQAAQAKLTVTRTKALNAMTMPELLAHKAALIGALELAEGGSPQ